MFSKIGITFAAFFAIGYSSFSQTNSGSLPLNTVTSVNETNIPAAKDKNIKPVENKSTGSSVKEINKKKRRSVPVMKVKKDIHSAKKDKTAK